MGCLFPLPGGAGTRYLVQIGRRVVGVNVYRGGAIEVAPRPGQRVPAEAALAAAAAVKALLLEEGERKW